MPSFTSDVTFSLIGSKSIWSIKTTLFTWLLHQLRAAEHTSTYLSETRNFMQIIRQKNTHYLLFILKNVRYVLHSGGVGAVVKISASQSWGPRFDSRPGRGLNIWWPSFPLKFTQLSILPGSVKWVPAYMDRFEAAARGAYICFRPAGVNWSWKRWYINAPLYFTLHISSLNYMYIQDEF